MADKIPLSDLPQGVPGAFDKVAGVDTATGASRLFPLPQPGVPRSYATRASLPAASGFDEGYTVWVNNDPTPANNGSWAVFGGAWVQSADRVTGLEAKISGVTDTLSAVVQEYGLAGVIPNGTSAAGNGTYTFNVPLAVSGNRVRLAIYARSAGTVYVQSVTRSGTTNTVTHEAAAVLVTGYNVVTLTLPHTSGQYLGIRHSTQIIAISTAASSFQYWNTGVQVAAGNSYEDAATAGVNTVFHLRLELVPQVATGQNVLAIEDSLGDLSNVVGGDGAGNVWIGGPQGAAPVDGSTTGASTYVAATAASRPLRATRIRAYCRAPGTVTLRRFSRSGNEFTAQGDDAVVELTAIGAVDVDIPDFHLEPGEYYGITKSANVVSTVSVPSADGYYVGGADATSFTSAAPAFAYTIQASVEFEPNTLINRVESLEASGAAVNEPSVPDSFIVVWGLGESHMAGRGQINSTVALPAGVAYKYTRSSGLIEHMADPTGNDVSALGSFGPALADAVWRMSNGTMGVILVNSGLGSSRIDNQWAAGNTGWTQALADWTDAIAKIEALALPVAGAAVVLAIGSNNAAAGTDKAAFKAAVLDLYMRCRTAVGAGDRLPMILAQTGDFTDGSNAASVDVIRAAQNELVAENDDIRMGWTGAKTFVARGMMRDNVHYVQLGHDIWGRSTAAVLLASGPGLYPVGLG